MAALLAKQYNARAFGRLISNAPLRSQRTVQQVASASSSASAENGINGPDFQRNVAKYQRKSLKMAPAVEVRTLVHDAKLSTLATNGTEDVAGFPFASIMSHCVDDEGRIITSFSTLSKHNSHLLADDRCSVLVTSETFEDMADARCCVTGQMKEVTELADKIACRELYMQRHPDHFWVSDFGDFCMFRMEITSVSVIGGFGDAAMVSPEEYLGAQPDPVSRFGKPVCEHMNAKHAESTLQMVENIVDITVDEARLIGIDSLGLDVECSITEPSEKFKIRLPFDEPALDRNSVKDRVVQMTKAAKKASA